MTAGELLVEMTMEDGEPFDFPGHFDASTLFPEHYFPVETGRTNEFRLNLISGEAHFIIDEYEVAGSIQFYEEFDELHEEIEFFDPMEYARGLIDFVAEQISIATGRRVEVRF